MRGGWSAIGPETAWSTVRGTVSAAFASGWATVAAHWLCLLAMVALLAVSVRLRRQTTQQAAERWRERRLREELEAYARIDPSLTQGLGEGMDTMHAGKALARRVCRTVAEKSVFNRVAMLLRNAEGRFACMGSVGVDDLTVSALHAWGERIVAEERSGSARSALAGGGQAGAKSFTFPLGEWHEFDREVSTWQMAGHVERRRWRRGIMAPIRTHSGRMVGAIAVCADGTVANRGEGNGFLSGLEKAMGPIESLAARIATAMENEAMGERLLRAEKMAGLGQLAGGVAHALNNPLTAVLGFAELIAETAGEARVRRDAETIQQEALKMKDTVARLIEFWRPATLTDEAVDVCAILRGLIATCEATLATRGVTIELVGATDVPPVRGSRDRIRQVMEHLLNNAAQAIATHQQPEEEARAIRITVSADERTLHLIVSDTGPGFREPARVFDPFYTTKGPEQGAGMGLSICYGVVREHGGEISAFNLHPHGAAVVVELPVRRTVRPERLVVNESLRRESGLPASM